MIPRRGIKSVNLLGKVELNLEHESNLLVSRGSPPMRYARPGWPTTWWPGWAPRATPMINEGKWQDVTWPDNWTAVTIDGLRSAQFEHTVLITERTEENPKGYEILTMRKDEPVMVWTDDKFQR